MKSMLLAVQRNATNTVVCMTSLNFLRQRVFRENNVDFADISRFKCPVLIRASPNLHNTLQSHTFISTLHGYICTIVYNITYKRIFKVSLFNTLSLQTHPILKN